MMGGQIRGIFGEGKSGLWGGQRCGEAHLHRYLAAFDFRYNRRTALGLGDAERPFDLSRNARDKCLTYRRIDEPSYA